MAEYDFLAGLTRMLASSERREQTRLQTSLATMEMAQKRKVQSFDMITKQLEIGTTANQQLQLKVAGRFLDDSGLNSLIDIDYTTPKDKMETPDLNKAVNALKKGKWGKFSDSDAQRIVSAVWLFRASQDPTNVIEIMSDLRNEMETGEGDLYKSFKRGSGHSSKNLRAFKGIDDLVWQAQESIKIGKNLSNEYREISEGDFKITSDLGLAERIPPSIPGKDTSISGFGSDEKEGYQETIIDDIRDKNEQISQIQKSKRQAEITEKTIQDRIAAGTATDDEKEQLLKMSSIHSMWDDEIQKLQSDISQVKSSSEALAELEIRELVRKVGKKGAPRVGERMIAQFAKGGTFELLEQMPDDLVALIVSGDRDGTISHSVIGHTRFVNDEGEMQRLTEKESGKLVRLAETVRKARALEAGKRGTGYVKSIDLPYEPPPPDAPMGPPIPEYMTKPIPSFPGQTDEPPFGTDDSDPISQALNALISPAGITAIGVPPLIPFDE